jgi:hypothetical protein
VLPLGVAAERSVNIICYFVPSGVCALPLGRCCGMKCPLYLVLFFFFLSPPHTFLPEGVVLGLQNFARSFKSQKK